jgi:hypothetical protein
MPSLFLLFSHLTSSAWYQSLSHATKNKQVSRKHDDEFDSFRHKSLRDFVTSLTDKPWVSNHNVNFLLS